MNLFFDLLEAKSLGGLYHTHDFEFVVCQETDSYFHQEGEDAVEGEDGAHLGERISDQKHQNHMRDSQNMQQYLENISLLKHDADTERQREKLQKQQENPQGQKSDNFAIRSQEFFRLNIRESRYPYKDVLVLKSNQLETCLHLPSSQPLW